MHLVDTSTPHLISVAEAAESTGSDIFTVLRLAEEGEIPSEVRRLVDLNALRRYFAANPTETT